MSVAMSVRAGRLGIAVAVVSVTAWAACAVYSSDLLLQSAPLDAGADAGDAATDASPPNPDADTCAHAYPPSRPATDDPSDASDIEVVIALTSIDFGLDGGRTTLSYDLDRVCTCPGPESCAPTQGAPAHCDDPGGRDNSGGELFGKLASLDPSLDPSSVGLSFQQGKSGLLLRLRNYNGQPNDHSVEAAVFASNGLMANADGGSTPPKHDGKDEWSASPGSLLGGIGPPFIPTAVDVNAYVTGDELVVNVDFPLHFSGGWDNVQPFVLHGSYLTGTLVHVNGSFGITGGRVAGRWSTRQLLTQMQVLADPLLPGKFLCGTDVTYQGLKASICGAADVSSNLLADPSSPCDAISLAIGFDGEPALLTGVVPDAPPVPLPCGSTYTDQCQ